MRTLTHFNRLQNIKKDISDNKKNCKCACYYIPFSTVDKIHWKWKRIQVYMYENVCCTCILLCIVAKGLIDMPHKINKKNCCYRIINKMNLFSFVLRYDKQDGLVVMTPAYGSEGLKLDPRKHPFVQLS